MSQLNSDGIELSPKESLFKALKVWAISLWLSFQADNAVAQTQQSLNTIMYCDIGPIDFSKLTVPYTVVWWDTLSWISNKIGVPYADIILVWQYLYPERNINQLKLWETFLVPSSNEQDLATIALHREKIQKERDYAEIIELWDNWEHDKILERFWFQLFPSLPVWIWLQAFNDAMLLEYQDSPRALWPRIVDIELQKLVICANLSRWSDRYAIWLDKNLPIEVLEWLLTEWMDAWKFTQWYTKVWYTQLFDARWMFVNRLSKWSIPIKSESREAYWEYLIEMQKYLQENGVAGSKIPAFFLYTNAIPDINSFQNGANPNSHVFSYVWESVNDPFQAQEFKPFLWGRKIDTFQEWVSVLDYLTYVSQDLWGMWNSLTPNSFKVIQNNLKNYTQFIELYINWEKIDIAWEFENPTIWINSTDMIQFWGSIVFDGFHVNTSEDEDIKENMNMRLMPFWAVLSLEVFYPTEILETPEYILNLWYSGKYWEILKKIVPEETFYLGENDKVTDVFYSLISEKLYWDKDYNRLSEEEKYWVQSEYKLQSLAYQMYWYQTNGWAEWNPGSTKINAPMYLFKSDNIPEVYREYISQKKIDYYNSLQVFCESWELQKLPFFQVQFFPGDTTASLLYQLQYQLSYTNPELARKLWDFDRIQKNALLKNIFSDEIASWNIPAWEAILLSVDKQIVSLEILSMNIYDEGFVLLDKNWELSLDTQLIEQTSTNPTMQYLLSYILASESYIQKCNDCSEAYKQIVWMIWDNTITSRRWIKNILYYVQQYGYTQELNTLLKENWFSDFFEELWLPRDIPTISSYWDYQLRFFNLLWPNYESIWPWKYLKEIVASITNKDSEYSWFIESISSHYPDIVEADLKVLQEIQELLNTEDSSSHGRKIFEKIKELLRLDDGTHSNIIGKILSLEMMNYKIQEHFENIATQISLSWWSIENLDDNMRIRFAQTSMLANNMWEGTQLLAITENYIQRIITTLDIIYPGYRKTQYPEVDKWSWFLDQIEYWRGQFRKNIVIYQQMLSEYPEYKEVIDIKKILATLTEFPENYSSLIFDFLKSEHTRWFLSSKNIDDSILPTLWEYQSQDNTYFKTLFRYVNNKSDIEQRIEQPEMTANNFVAPWILIMLLLWKIAQLPIWIIKRKVKRSIKYSKNRKNNIQKWIESRKRKTLKKNTVLAETIMWENVEKISLWDIDAYMKTVLNYQWLVLSNEHWTWIENNYFDWNYTIKWNKWIQHFKAFKNNENLVLTNILDNSESINYADGQYHFFDSLTQLVRDVTNKTLSETIMLEQRREKQVSVIWNNIENMYQDIAAE